MEGYRHAVTSADGTRIGLLTAGDGPPLLLVHGGMGQIESWQTMWATLAGQWRVTAMDRRGRGTSGDALAVVSATMPREAQALATVDLKALAAEVSVPVLLILGSVSLAWARDIIGDLAAVMPQSTLAVLDGQGHEATDTAPDLLASRLATFFSY